MRLAALIPSISQELVDALESLHVQTSSDLLFHTAPLDLFLRLPPGLATLQEILQLRTLVTERASAPGSSGSQVLERHLSTIRRNRAVTSGIRVLDILFEGLDAAHLLHISGDRHVGKSVSRVTVTSTNYDSVTAEQFIGLLTITNNKNILILGFCDAPRTAEPVTGRIGQCIVDRYDGRPCSWMGT